VRHSPRKKVLFTTIPLIATLLLLFAAGEIALRLHFVKIERITGATDWQVGEAEGLKYFWDQYHPRLGWTNVPGYRSDERIPWRVTINRQRLRGENEYAPSPPTGVRRLAVFGDSSAFGEEVDDHESIPAYLEHWLNNVEALNYGIHGYSLGQMMLRLEDEGFALKPDHVVFIVLVPNTIYRNPLPSFVHNKPVFGVAQSRLAITNIPVPEASRQPWFYRHCFVAAWLFGQPTETEQLGERVGRQLDITHAILERVRRQCENRGVPWTLIQVMLPRNIKRAGTDMVYRKLINRLRLSLNNVEADELDLIRYLLEAYDLQGTSLEAPNGHWAARGNCLIAGRIAQHLASMDPAWSLNQNAAACVDQPAQPVQHEN